MAIQSFSLDNNTIQQLDRLIRSHRDEMTRMVGDMMDRVSGSGFGSSMGFGGLRRGNSAEDYKLELESFLVTLKATTKRLSASEEYQRKAAKRELEALNRRMEADRAAAEAAEENTDAQDDNTESNQRNTDALRQATDQLGQWARGLAAGTLSFKAVTSAVNEFEQAYKTGLNWNALSDTLHSAFTMGLSPKDMMDFQAKFRRVSNTFGDGIEGFTKVASANQVEWMKYTGNLKEAAFMQGEFTDIALSMGTGIKDVNGAVNVLFDRFKNLQAVTSMTAEQFVQMQRSMLSEVSVRDKLVGLQGKERLNYMAGLTQTNMAFRMMGMTQEVSDRLVKFIEQQSTKGARSRLKEAAQLSVVAQTLGMSGEQASRLAELHRRRNKSAEDKAEYAQLGQALKEAQEKYRNSGQFNQGIATGEYLVDALGSIAPILNELGNASADGILSRGAEANSSAIVRQQAEIADRNEGLQGKIIESIVKFSNMFSAWGASALAALIGGTWAAGSWGRRVFGGAGGPGGAGGAGGAGGGLGGRLGRFGQGMWGNIGRYGRAGAVGLGVGLVGMAGQAVFDPQSEEKKNYWDKGAAGAALGATLGSVVPGLGTAAGATVGGILGVGYAFLDNQGAFEDALTKQKKAIIEQTNAAELKFKFDQDYYDKEIARIKQIGEARGQVDQAELDRLERMKAASKEEFEQSNAKNAVDSFAYEARNLIDAKNSFTQTAKDVGDSWGWSYGTTDDVAQGLQGMKGRLSMAGVDMTDEQLRQMLAVTFQQAAIESGTRGADVDATYNALKNGGNFDYDNSTINPLLGKAMEKLIPQLTEQMNSNLSASVAERFKTPEQLKQLQSNLEDIQKQVDQDKAIIEMARTNPHMSTAGAEAERRLQENTELATLLQQLVNDKTVKIDGETTDLFTRMAESLEKIAGEGKRFNQARSRA